MKTIWLISGYIYSTYILHDTQLLNHGMTGNHREKRQHCQKLPAICTISLHVWKMN